MRNTIAVALSFVYLTLAVGVAKTTHYCMGRLNTSSLFTFEKKQCACAILAESSSHSCCHDEHQLVKIENDQSQVAVISVHAPDFFEIGIITNPLSISRISWEEQKSESFFSDSSPPPPQVPIFKLNCSLVFYA